jgi:hypothetical protein
MLGWTEYLIRRIQALRIKELADYADYRKFATYRNVFGAVPDTLAPPITLMVRVNLETSGNDKSRTDSGFSGIHFDAWQRIIEPDPRVHDPISGDAIDWTSR